MCGRRAKRRVSSVFTQIASCLWARHGFPLPSFYERLRGLDNLKQSWIIHRHGTIDTFFSQPFSRQDERTGVHPRPAQTPRDAAPRAAPRARVHATCAATHGSSLWTDSAWRSLDEGLGEKRTQQSHIAIGLAAHRPALRLARPTRLPQCLTGESSHADAAARQSKTALQVLAPPGARGLMSNLGRSPCWPPSTECAQLGHQGLMMMMPFNCSYRNKNVC